MMKTDGYHCQIGHHLARADELSERFDHAADLIGFIYQFVVCLFGLQVPVPGVFERRDLRLRVGPALVFEQNVVVAVGIEWRVKVDQVNGLVPDVFPQDI